jgi:chorismate mutase
MFADAHPAELEADVLTIEFPATASFLRRQAEEPKNAALLQEALYAVTGRRLALAFAVGPEREQQDSEHERPATEEEIVELMKSTFDARELDE